MSWISDLSCCRRHPPHPCHTHLPCKGLMGAQFLYSRVKTCSCLGILFFFSLSFHIASTYKKHSALLSFIISRSLALSLSFLSLSHTHTLSYFAVHLLAQHTTAGIVDTRIPPPPYPPPHCISSNITHAERSFYTSRDQNRLSTLSQKHSRLATFPQQRCFVSVSTTNLLPFLFLLLSPLSHGFVAALASRSFLRSFYFM
jgi:hypothetical protein